MTFSKIYDFLGNFFQPCTIDDRKVAIVKNVKSSLKKIFFFLQICNNYFWKKSTFYEMDGKQKFHVIVF